MQSAKEIMLTKKKRFYLMSANHVFLINYLVEIIGYLISK